MSRWSLVCVSLALTLLGGCLLGDEHAAPARETIPDNPCQSRCNHIYYTGCIGAAEHSRCYGLCEGADAVVREQFLFCSDLEPACEVDCYDTLTVTTCQSMCNQLKGEECLSSRAHELCFHGCREEPVTIREQFTYCARNSACLEPGTSYWGMDYCAEVFGSY